MARIHFHYVSEDGLLQDLGCEGARFRALCCPWWPPTISMDPAKVTCLPCRRNMTKRWLAKAIEEREAQEEASRCRLDTMTGP